MKQKKGSRVKEAKDNRIKKLENKVRRLEKDKRELISKLNTLEAALEKNIKTLKGSTEDLSVEDLIEAANNGKTIKEVKDEVVCPQCGEKEGYKKMRTLFGYLTICSCGYTHKELF